jgi:hypothetical protein
MIAWMRFTQTHYYCLMVAEIMIPRYCLKYFKREEGGGDWVHRNPLL